MKRMQFQSSLFGGRQLQDQNDHPQGARPVKTWFAAWLVVVVLAVLLHPIYPTSADVNLTVDAITWNVLGLDSNNVNVGPNNFPIGAHVCNTGSDAAVVSSGFIWDDGKGIFADSVGADAYINLRAGSKSEFSGASAVTLAHNACYDFYYEVTVNRLSTAYDNTRRYHITASYGSGPVVTVSSSTPRELYVEHLVSQNRNQIDDIILDGTSKAAGATLNLLVGGTYTIELVGHTSTGYNQLESFINISNTILRINSVLSTFQISTLTPNPNYPQLYADSCGWDPNPYSPTYRSCVVSDNKTGGIVHVVYNVTVLSGAGTNQPLTSLFYDFSGSSYHYNSDYASSLRLVSVQTPLAFSKSFSPATIEPTGTSTLTFTIVNHSAAAQTKVNFSDALPSITGAQMQVNATTTATTGCSFNTTPTLTAVANASTISLSNASIAGSGTCTFSVTVKQSDTTKTGTFLNTSGNLYIDTVNTGLTASASLVSAAKLSGTGFCSSTTKAQWTFEAASVPSPAASTNTTGGTVAAFNAKKGNGAKEGISSFTTGTKAWWANNNTTATAPTTATDNFFVFTIPTSAFTSGLSLSFDMSQENSAATSTTPALDIYVSKLSATPASATDLTKKVTVTGVPDVTTTPASSAWKSTGTIAFLPAEINLNAGGNTYFYVYGHSFSNAGTGTNLLLDNVTFSALTCSPIPSQPTLAKSFSPKTIQAGGTSTLTFTLTNPNTQALTGASVTFTDVLPAGVTLADAPAYATTCSGGSLSGAYDAGTGLTTLTFSGGTIPASSYCTASVVLKAAAAGVYVNTSGPISTVEGGTNTTQTTASLSSTLTALLPPTFAKDFAPNPIYANDQARPSVLSFVLGNPNQTALTSAGFTDVLPAHLAAAATPSITTTCGGSLLSAVNLGVTTLTFSGGTIPANNSCTVTIKVVADQVSVTPYTNTTGALSTSTSIGGETVVLTGGTASADLAVIAHYPTIKLSKQVATSASGPWKSYVTVPKDGNVYYRLTVENAGDVTLTNVLITDLSPAINLAACDSGGGVYPFASAAVLNAGDVVSCVVAGPTLVQPGAHVVNTATATAEYNASPITPSTSTAEYLGVDLKAGPALTVIKQISASASGPWVDTLTPDVNPGATIYYKFLIINNSIDTSLSTIALADNKIASALAAANCVWTDPLVFNAVSGNSTTCTVRTTASTTSGATVTNTATASGVYAGPTTINSAADTATYTVTSSGNQVSGTLWIDTDADGNIDEASPTFLSGVSVSLYADNSGTAGSLITSVLTDSNGLYTFGGLPAASYWVNVPAQVSPYIHVSGRTDPFKVTVSGSDIANINFGYQPEADLSVSKDDGAASVSSGGTTAYTIRVTNNGPADVTGAVLTDTVGAGLSTGSAVITCTSAANNTCVSAPGTASLTGSGVSVDLLSGKFYEILVSGVQVTSTGASVTNTAAAAVPAGVNDPSPSNNSKADVDTVTTYTISGALWIDSDSDGVIDAGESGRVPGAVVGLYSDSELTVLVNSGTTGADGLYAFTGLPVGSYWVSIPETVAPNVHVTGANPRALTITTADLSAVNFGYQPTADLSVSKDDGVLNVSSGGTTAYTIRVSNSGPTDVTAAVLTDSFGAGLSTSSAVVTCSAAANNTCVSAPSLSTLTVGGVSVNLLSGKFYEITISGVKVTSTGASVTNTAAVAAPAGVTDTNNSNNTAADTDTVTSYSISGTLWVDTDKDGAIDAGEIGRVSGAAVSLYSDSGLTTLVASMTTASDGLYSFSSLPIGSYWVSIPEKVSPYIHVTGTNPAAETITTGSLTGVNFGYQPEVDLAVSKSDGAAAVSSGGTTAYTIRVTNNGPADVSGAVLTDTFGAGLSTSSAVVTCTAAANNTCASAPALASLTGSGVSLDLLSGKFYEIQVAGVKVTSTGASVTNTAAAAVPAGVTDPTAPNNSAADTDTVTTYTISGALWIDSDKDGVIDAGETGRVSGAVVNLYSDSGLTALVATQTTAADGLYAFTTLPVGSYWVSIPEKVSPYIRVTGTNPRALTVTTADFTAINFGYQPEADLVVTKSDSTASVSSGAATAYTIRVTNNGPADVTAAVLTDTFGAGLSTASVTITCSSAVNNTCVSAPALASLTGSGVSVDLQSGKFYEILVSGVKVTSTGASVTNTAAAAVPAGVTDPTAGNNSAADTDTVITYSVGGTLWVDSDKDSAIDAGEIVRVSGAAVNLYSDSGLTALVAATTTASDGTYAFTTLPVGSYWVSIPEKVSPYIHVTGTNPAAETITTANLTGVNFGYQPEVDLAVSKSDGVLNLSSGAATAYTVRVTNNGPADVTGAVLTDTFGAGLSSSGAVVTCTAAANNTCASAPALASLTGSGVSLDLLSGKFYEILVSGVQVTSTGASVTNTAAAAVPAGVTDSTAGNNSAADTDTVTAYTIGGTLWLDSDSDGVIDAGETGRVSGAVVNLYSDSGLTALVATQTTGANGLYSFTSLPIGSYWVSIPEKVSPYIRVTGTNPRALTVTTADFTAVNFGYQPEADLVVSKSDGALGVSSGSTIAYTIRVTNSGPADVTAAVLTDSFGAGLSTASVTITCSAAANNTCASAPALATLTGSGVSVNLQSGKFYEILVSGVKVTSTGASVTNSAAVAAPAGVTDPTAGNNSASDTDTVSTYAVDGTLWVDGDKDGVIDAGETGRVSGAVVNLYSDSGLTALVATVTTGSDGTYAFTTLPVGSYWVSIPEKVTPLIHVTGTNPRPLTISSAGFTGINFGYQPEVDLAVDKYDGLSGVSSGNTTNYTIRVTNNGPADVTGAVLTDTVGAGLNTGSVVVTCSSAPNNTCVSAPTLASLTGSGVSLNLLSGKFYEILVGGVRVTATSGTVANTAAAAVPAGVTDSVSANNMQTDTDTVDSFSMTGTLWGDTNKDGSIDAPETVRLYNVPVGLYNDSGGVIGTLLTTVYTDANGIFVFNNLGTGTYWISVPEKFSPYVRVTGVNPRKLVISIVDIHSIDFGYQPEPDLAVTKTDGVTSVASGSTTAYTIRVTNNGPAGVTGAVLTDTFGAGLDLSSATVACSAAANNTCVSAPSLANLTGSGVSVSLLVDKFYEIVVSGVKVTSIGTDVTNTASVAAPDGVNDSNTANNTAADTDTVFLRADLAVTKTNSVTNLISGAVTAYTIRLTNTGPSPVTGVALTDTFGSGLSSTNASAACSAAANNTCVSAPSLASLKGSGVLVNLLSGQFYEIIVSNVKVTSTGESVTNLAAIVLPQNVTDSNTNNNTAADTDTVTAFAISGTLWGDINKDGVLDAGESIRLNGVTVKLYADQQLVNLIGFVTTDVSGVYTIANLPIGSYWVSVPEEVVPYSHVSGVNPFAVSITAADFTGVNFGYQPEVDLQITKTNATPGGVTAGRPTSYTIRVTNAGPSAVTGALLSDTFGGGLVYPNGLLACSSAANNTCVTAPTMADLVSGTVSIDLLSGKFYEIVVSAVLVTTPSGQSVTNTASILAPATVVETNLQNNTAAAVVAVTGSSWKVYLPTVSKAIATSVTWGVAVGYEDLPLSGGKNDYDFNDWMVQIDGTADYVTGSAALLNKVTMDFNPKARASGYYHSFFITIPANKFASDGTAVLEVFDGSHVLKTKVITAFIASKDNEYNVFENTATVFPLGLTPGGIVNGRESDAYIAPQRYARLTITFNAPFAFTDFISFAPAQQLGVASMGGKPFIPAQSTLQSVFFNPLLLVMNTAEKIHSTDVRTLVVPVSNFKHPEEAVRIDKAYPQVTFVGGAIPTITFPTGWWLEFNHCVYDGIACVLP